MAGHEVYDFREPWPGQEGFSWRECAPRSEFSPQQDWKRWPPAHYRMVLETHPAAAQGFLTDFRAMKRADVGVLVMPAGRSAHLELGWMAGAGKRTVILWAADCEPELMALLADDIVLSIDELLARLGGVRP